MQPGQMTDSQSLPKDNQWAGLL